MGLGLGLGGLGLDSQGLIDQAKAHGVSGILMDISEVRKQPVADWRRQKRAWRLFRILRGGLTMEVQANGTIDSQ